MNRQIVAFLSLFSLVLVLSVYYVTLPFQKNNNKEVEVSANIEEASDIYFESIALEKQTLHNEKIKEYELNIASSSYSDEEKIKYLNLIKDEKNMMKVESFLEEKIIDEGYPYSYVSLTKDNVKVITYKNDYNLIDLDNIMSNITTYLDDNMQVYVEFYS